MHKSIFQANGYPHVVTAGVLSKKRRHPPTGTDEDVQKCWCCPMSKTHVKVPTPPEEQKCVVYRDSCKCGSVYVGETGRQMKTHIEDIKREL